MDCRLRYDIVRCAIRARCVGILPQCTCLYGVEEPVHLNPTHIFRVCRLALWWRAGGIWVPGRESVRLSTRRRWYVVLFSWEVLFLFICEVPDERATENEDNDASQSPANDCPQRYGRPGEIHFNLVPRISQNLAYVEFFASDERRGHQYKGNQRSQKVPYVFVVFVVLISFVGLSLLPSYTM